MRLECAHHRHQAHGVGVEENAGCGRKEFHSRVTCMLPSQGLDIEIPRASPGGYPAETACDSAVQTSGLQTSRHGFFDGLFVVLLPYLIQTNHFLGSLDHAFEIEARLDQEAD